MIIIIRALSQWGKDDGDYDSPTSRDETPDEKKRKEKEAKEAQIKKEAKESQMKKRGHKKREKAQIKKREKKGEGTMLLSFYHTCASK